MNCIAFIHRPIDSNTGIIKADASVCFFVVASVTLIQHDRIVFQTCKTIGAGVLVAEIQENSNVTYRLYDYDRVDQNGKKRTLHIEKALDVAVLHSSAFPRQPMRVLKYKNGCASELLTRCKYFQVERLILNTEIHRGLAAFQTGTNSFHSLLCVEGCGVLFGADITIPFFKGDCIFIPAESIELKLHGKAQLLNVSC